ncbi:MAG: hypothetical protein PUP93_18725 [Rhizonema sp. NSF051]|nr:hypothetical protein [Rhizonema sp. NSF051]
MTYSIEIFKTGTHTANNGVTRTYDMNDLQEVVDTYDPSYFKAPLIFNYFSDDPHSTLGYDDRAIEKSPFAFGYPEALKISGDRLVAEFNKISPEFVQWNKDGKILSVSASLYPENYSHNPYGDKLSLRHIAALGTEPPAVKGLTPLSLNEEPEGKWALSLNEFSEEAIADDEESLNHAMIETDYSWQTLKSLFQRLREKLIADKGIDEADKLYPQFMIDALMPKESDNNEDEEEDDSLDEETLNRVNMLSSQVSNINNRLDGLFHLIMNQPQPVVSSMSSYQEQNIETQPIEETITMSEELAPHPVAETQEYLDLKARIAQLEADNKSKDRAARVKDLVMFAEKQSSSEERKILPTHFDNELNIMIALMDREQQGSQTVSFAEGDTKLELSPLEAYKKIIVSRSPLWDNTVLPTKPEDAPDNFSEANNGKMMAERAKVYRKMMKDKGINKTLSECINDVAAGKDKDMM